jgi:hypothetical protein
MDIYLIDRDVLFDGNLGEELRRIAEPSRK